MSQSTDVVLTPHITGAAQRTELNDIFDAFLTGHSGASRPSYLTGKTGCWTKIVSGTAHELYYFDGTDDILMGTVNFSTNSFTPAGATAAFGNAVDNKTAAYTIVDGDCGKIITADATGAAFSLAIDPTAGLRSGWYVIVQKTDATANSVTIDPASTDTINGITTFVLSKQRDAVLIVRATNSTFVALTLPNTANLARLDGAAFTVSPTMPTPSGGDNTTKGATTAFVTSAVAAAVAPLAPLASPAFTGTPTAPTASPGDNDTSIATTAFVTSAITAAVAGLPAAPVTSVSAGAGMTVSPTTGAVVAGINTNNAIGVGAYTLLKYNSNTALAPGATTSSSLEYVGATAAGVWSAPPGTPAVTGTWRNMSGCTLQVGSVAVVGLFMRVS